MKVYLVWQRAGWQGDTLLGGYARREDAEARGAGIVDVTIEEVVLGEDMNSWHGN